MWEDKIVQAYIDAFLKELAGEKFFQKHSWDNIFDWVEEIIERIDRSSDIYYHLEYLIKPEIIKKSSLGIFE
jgi:hypothetical protein